RLQGDTDLPARLHVHESGSVRGDHLVAAAQRDWRRARRHGRALPALAGRSRADAAVPAVTRRHSARRRIPGQVLHLPEPYRKPTLLAGVARRALFAVWTLLLPEDCKLNADARAHGNRTAARQPRNALRGGRDGADDAGDRRLSGTVHSRRQLVVGDRTVAACSGVDQVGLLSAISSYLTN